LVSRKKGEVGWEERRGGEVGELEGVFLLPAASSFLQPVPSIPTGMDQYEVFVHSQFVLQVLLPETLSRPLGSMIPPYMQQSKEYHFQPPVQT
jgi:hypothetical protein